MISIFDITPVEVTYEQVFRSVTAEMSQLGYAEGWDYGGFLGLL